jgi:16S rRNA processing protein RimM
MSSWRSCPTRPDPGRLTVARIHGAKGLEGRLRVEPMTDWPERLAVGSTVYLDGDERARRVIDAEHGGRLPVIRIEGIDDRGAAEGLAGRFLEAEPRDLPDGAYYWHQLEGLVVTDEAGTVLGHVVEVFRAGENEVYRVEGPGGEHLIPALKRVVRRIDLAAGEITVAVEEAEEVR